MESNIENRKICRVCKLEGEFEKNRRKCRKCMQKIRYELNKKNNYYNNYYQKNKDIVLQCQHKYYIKKRDKLKNDAEYITTVDVITVENDAIVV
jgi:hypothetical protein